MKTQTTYQVKDLARLAKVSVRTLHHYDHIGLLSPQQRTDAGYRVYGEPHLLRLQQILLYRNQGLSLEAIRRMLDDPNFDPREALLLHREHLLQRAQQTANMIRSIDHALATLPNNEDHTMNANTLFDGFEHEDHKTEAQQRWGNTDSFAISKERTSKYTPEDWATLKAEQDDIYKRAYTAFKAGIATDATEAMEIAEDHRLSMDRWFYPCSHAMHQNLAHMYTQDARFMRNIDKYGEGLTTYLSAAIVANALYYQSQS